MLQEGKDILLHSLVSYSAPLYLLSLCSLCFLLSPNSLQGFFVCFLNCLNYCPHPLDTLPSLSLCDTWATWSWFPMVKAGEGGQSWMGEEQKIQKMRRWNVSCWILGAEQCLTLWTITAREERRVSVCILYIHIYLMPLLSLTLYEASHAKLVSIGSRTGSQSGLQWIFFWGNAFYLLTMIMWYYPTHYNDAGYFYIHTLMFTDTLLSPENYQNPFPEVLTQAVHKYHSYYCTIVILFMEKAACGGTRLCPCSLYRCLSVHTLSFLSFFLPLSFHTTGF